MRRIYLDHNHWVSLARVETGHPDGTRYQDLYDALKQKVERGEVVLPLSATHFLEVSGTGSDKRRGDMAGTMARFSMGWVLAPFPAVYPLEVENAVRRSLAIEEEDVSELVLGRGSSHAFGDRPVITGLPPDVAAMVLEAIESPETSKLLMTADFGNAHRQQAREVEARGAAEINAMRARARAARVSKVTLLEHNQRDFMKHRYIPALLDSTRARGIADEDLVERLAEPKPGRLEVMMSCPSIDTWITTSVERDHAWDRDVTGNDIRDQAFLAVAVPYCDIVVTERYFGGVLNRSGLADRHACRVLTSLEELVDHLDEA